jgi:hypothetical protein
MISTSRRLAVATALLFLGGCSGAGGVTATGPSPVTSAGPSAPAPTAARGDIRIASITRASGSTIAVGDCGSATMPIPGRHICSDQWGATFEVDIDSDIADAVLSVSLQDGAARCADAYSRYQPVAAGSRTSFSTSGSLYLTYEGDAGVVVNCTVPRTTTKMIVALWRRGNAAVPVLRQEFDVTYQLEPR